MPFPAVLVWGAAAVAAGVGVKKGFDAKEDFGYAKSIGERAETKYKDAEKSLEKSRKSTQNALETLGKMKVLVFSNQIKHLVDVLRQLKDASSSLKDYDEKVFVENLQDIENLVQKSLEVEKGLGSAAISGTLAALGAYGSVGMLATASTGTAIGTLSGAAATNATLAWLGGGSLAAGGFGVAGGMVALGGIALAPVLAVGGFWMASKAEEAKTKAQEYESQVSQAVEKMAAVETMLKGIRTACAEQAGVIKELVIRFEQVKVSSAEDRTALNRMVAVGKALKEVLMIPVLQDDGTANPNIRKQCSGYLKV